MNVSGPLPNVVPQFLDFFQRYVFVFFAFFVVKLSRSEWGLFCFLLFSFSVKVLVTGSSGFIGTHLVERLLQAGLGVCGLDRQSPTRRAHEPFWEKCDLRERDRLIDVVHKAAPDAVIHLAARTDLGEREKLSGYDDNISGVENLLAAMEACPSIARGIFTSSQLVCPIGYRPGSDTDYRPETLYGQSKVMGERAVRARDGAGRPWCIVRPTTIWGPGMNSHYRSFLTMISNGRYRHVGRRTCHKSWGYVGNIALQYQKFLETPVARIHRKVFYLADYEPLSLRDWANAWQAELGAKPIKTVPEPAAWLVAKAGDILNHAGFKEVPFTSFRLRNVLTESVVDLAETKEVCGEVPYSMQEAIRETAAWFKGCQKLEDSLAPSDGEKAGDSSGGVTHDPRPVRRGEGQGEG